MNYPIDGKSMRMITGIDPDEINQWVHSGVYWFAPSTVAGAARRWMRADVVALMLARHLQHVGIGRAAAFSIAHKALKTLMFECNYRGKIIASNCGVDVVVDLEAIQLRLDSATQRFDDLGCNSNCGGRA